MDGGSPLIATLIASLALAYAGGLGARALKLPPLAGYLVAGVVLGPFTPGFMADQHIVEQLAEIGVALLLFGVGLHFSIGDLLAVWRTALPGALIQILASAALGVGIAVAMGFTPSQAIVMGACLSIASTVVATRGLGEHGKLTTETGRIALGWLVLQDLAVVAVLVVLPEGRVGPEAIFGPVLGAGVKLLKVVGFAVVMQLVGRHAIPWLLTMTARDGSRELFRLAVIVVALGIAFLASELIGVSPALGAFFAGVVIADSDVSHQAAGESLPVQQIFTVLFFVSVGMLFDPRIVMTAPLQVVAIAAFVIAGNTLVILLILLVLRTAPRSAVDVATALAQIGEFSFILSASAVNRGLLPERGRDLVLAAALLSILAQPFMFQLAAAVAPRLDRNPSLRRWHAGRRERKQRHAVPKLDNHAIIVGHGRVGSVIAASLRKQGVPYIVIEQDLHFAKMLRREGVPVIYGDAAWPEVLDAARPEQARLLVIAVPDRSTTRRILAAARHANPAIKLIVRTHSGKEAEWLGAQGISRVVMGESHAANEMANYALEAFRDH